MSNYRGGGYRDRERTGPYRDSYSDRERDRDWRDRERDRDGRRDSRYDDSRRRYDSHEGLERPLGDPYERNGDRRRPNRDYDRPPPRRFERDERDFDRPARYAPPASMYDGEHTDSLSIYQCSSVQLLQMSHADHAPRDVLADHPALLQALGTTGMSDRLQTTTTGKHPARDQCLLLRNLPALEDHARQADGQCHQHR